MKAKELNELQRNINLRYKDLCGRIIYDTVLSVRGCGDVYLASVNWWGEIGVKDYSNNLYTIEDVKPYLRPISSMTEKEMDRLFDILKVDKDGRDKDWIKINDDLGIKFFFPTGKWVENVAEAYDYLNSIYMDYRGLIAKGFAIEAKNGMYKL